MNSPKKECRWPPELEGRTRFLLTIYVVILMTIKEIVLIFYIFHSPDSIEPKIALGGDSVLTTSMILKVMGYWFRSKHAEGGNAVDN